MAHVSVDHTTAWLIAGAIFLLGIYVGTVIALIVTGRRSGARAVAGFIPDCVVFVKRLLADPEVPRRRKVALGLLLGYLISPIDLIPDFIPGLGQLDDALAIVLVLRYVLHGGGRGLLRERWPGPDSSRDLVERAAFG